MDDEDKGIIIDCIAIFNQHGREAADFMKEELTRAENEEAYSWFADLYEDG